MLGSNLLTDFFVTEAWEYMWTGHQTRFWVQPILQRRHIEVDLYHDHFWMYFGMLVGQFEALSQMLAPHPTRQSTNY